MGHIRYAGAIAARMAAKFPAKADDLLGLALLTMISSLDASIIMSDDSDHCLRRMATRIQGATINFAKEDKQVTVHTTSSWFTDLTKDEQAALLHSIDGFQSLDSTAQSEADSQPESVGEWIHTPAKQQKSEIGQIEMRDALNHWSITDTDRSILLAAVEGKTDAEIAATVGVSRQRVGQLRNEAARRFKAVLEGKVC